MLIQIMFYIFVKKNNIQIEYNCVLMYFKTILTQIHSSVGWVWPHFCSPVAL